MGAVTEVAMWMSKASHLVERFSYPTIRVVNGIGAGILTVMMFLTATDVCLRCLFDRPIVGVLELTELMLVTVVFFTIAYTATLKGHVSIELVICRFPQRARAIIESIAYFLSLGVVCLIVWQGVVQAETMRLTASVAGDTPVRLFPFLYVVAFGSALLCLVFLANLLNSLGQALKK